MNRPAFVLLVACLAGCSRPSSPPTENEQEGGAQGPRGAGPSQLGTLTGLYEGGTGSRLCILPGRRSSRFGLVLQASPSQSCSGSGTVSRDRGGLRFTMAGDSACTVQASIAGRTIRFESNVPSGCSYYCGAGARLADARFTQTGTTRQAAMKAADLVGEPLCGSD